jgi:hypothetical protein
VLQECHKSVTRVTMVFQECHNVCVYVCVCVCVCACVCVYVCVYLRGHEAQAAPRVHGVVL